MTIQQEVCNPVKKFVFKYKQATGTSTIMPSIINSTEIKRKY